MKTIAKTLRVTLALLTALAPFPGLGVSSASAQGVPARTHFQGRLTDASNNPLTGPNGFVFEIYDASSGGALLWTETQPAVPVANGVFAVELGAATPLPSTVFAGSTAYLQVTVNGNVMTPRERLVSAPYAHNAELLSGRAFSAFVSTDAAAQSIAGAKTFTGAVFVPAPTAAGHAASKAYVDAAGGTGLLASTNAWSGQNSFLNLVSVSSDLVITGVLNRGTPLSLGGPLSVAAGVTAASGTFTASGPAQFSLQTSSGVSVGGTGGVYATFFSGSGAGLTGIAASDVSKVLKAGDTMTGQLTLAGSTLTVTGDAFSVGGSTLVVVLGRVGIGTAGPTDSLHIRGNAPSLKLEHTGGADVQLHTSDGSGLAGIRITEGANKLSIQDAGDTIMARASGSVGIRTVDPAAALDVNGNAQFGSGAAKSTFTAAGALSLADGADLSLSGAGGAIATGSSVTASAFFGDGSNLTGIDAAGKVAKAGDFMSGQLTTESTITVKGNAFSVGTSTFVVSNGGVGIGTAAPAGLLSVMGDSAVGQLYIADSAGNQLLRLTDQGAFGRLRGAQGAYIDMADINYMNGLWVYGNTTIESSVNLATAGDTMLVGIGTTSPATKVHVSSGVLTVDGTGAAINVVGSSVNASAFFGDGSHLTGLTGADTSRVSKAGDTMTGPLELSSAALVVNGTGPAVPFQVGVSSLVVRQDGSVGIGTANPLSPLHVVLAGSGGVLTVEANNPMIVMDDDNSSDVGLWNVNGDFRFLRNDLATTNARIDQGGNVGIGTAGAPATKLHISSGTLTIDGNAENSLTTTGNVGIGTTGPGALLQVGTGAVDAQLRLGSDGGGYRRLLFFDTSAVPTRNNFQIAQQEVNNSLHIGPSTVAGGTVFNGAVGLVMNSLGDVGVGTTAPAYKLDVAGAINGTSILINGVAVGTGGTQWASGGGGVISYTGGGVGIGTAVPTQSLHIKDASGAAGRANLAIEATTENAYLNMIADAFSSNPGGTLVKQGSTGLLKMNNAGSSAVNHLVIDNQGQVGVGTVPSARLHVSSADAVSTDTIFQASSGTAAGSELLVVKGDGKVGVGTASPGAPLHVRGVAGGNSFISDGSDATAIVTSVNSPFLGLRGKYWTGAASSPRDMNLATLIDSGGNYRLAIADTSGSERVSITSAGNVGIGTTGPTKLATIRALNNVTGTITSLAGMGSNMLLLDAQDSNLDEKTGIAAKFAAGGIPAAMVLSREGVAWGTAIGFYTHNDDAVTLDQMAERMHISANGNVGIGTTGPGDKLHVKAATDQNIRVGQLTGTAAIYVYNDAASAYNDLKLDGSSIYLNSQSGGNVGIGTTNPLFNLQVGGYGVVTSQLWGAASWSQSGLISFSAASVNDGSTASAGFHTDTSAPGSTLQLDAGSAKAFTGVAIFSGRSSPQANVSKWDVQYSDDAAAWTTAYSGIDLTTTMGGWVEVRWQVKGVGPAHRYWRLYKINAPVGGDYVREVQFFEGNAEQGVVRTDGSGNVGIGTTSPGAKLHVSGATYLQVPNGGYTIVADSQRVLSGGIMIEGQSSNGMEIGNNNNAPLVFYNNITERMRIDAGGNVGVGTASPGAKLDVSQTAAGQMGARILMPTGAENTQAALRVQGYSPAIELMDKDNVQNWYMGIDDNDANKLLIGRGYGPGQGVTQAVTIDASDNVGIGTPTPAAPLHVVGSGVEPAYITTSGSDGALSILSLYGSAGADREFFFNNAGAAAADGAWGGPADYAEYFHSADETLKPGELVCIAGANEVGRCAGTGVLIGVVSTKPGVLGVYADDATDALEAYAKDPHWVQVGLMGQIPTRVSVKDGKIRAGDQLTAGGGGLAVKGASPRTLLIVALEDAAADGVIRALVK